MTRAKLRILRTIDAITLKRKLPVNVDEEHRPLFENLITCNVDDVNVVDITNAVLTSQGSILANLSTFKGMSLSNDNGEVIQYKLFDFLRIKFFWPSMPLRNDVRYLVVHNIFSHTYYHWLVEALPRLFLLRGEIPSSVLLLPSNHDQRFHVESLKLFGVRRTEILKDRTRYIVPKIITSTQIGRIANYHPTILNQMVEYMKSVADTDIDLGQKIYVSRSKASRRKIINESQVEDCVKKAGFSVVHFEDYSFIQQISIMHHCRFLIGLHGAGLVNMIFMTVGGRILELRKYDSGENYFYFGLSATVGHDYYYQFCDSSVTNISVQDSDIIVDIDKFQQNVTKMLQ
ncbi:MAG TPA: glycosyltransferase family 61 protein [Chryseolinea sp.]|nr:glycosyltransferase family 61 protein [Chryseolinea sp.]